MKFTTLLIALFATVSTAFCRYHITGAAGTWDGDLVVVQIEQVEDEVVVQISIKYNTVWQSESICNASININAPALLTKVVYAEKFWYDIDEEIPETINLLPETGYDFEAGDGWVDTDAVGYVYNRFFPWVWSPSLGWLYVWSSIAVHTPFYDLQADTDKGLIPVIDPVVYPMIGEDEYYPVGNAYWLWSPEDGWLLKADFSQWFYSFSKADWVVAEEL